MRLICPRFLPAMREAVVILILCGCHFSLVCPVRAGLESGAYQTLDNATAFEMGDRVTNRQRTVSFPATLIFDLGGSPASVTATLPKAVLEGGAPFDLTVRSSTGGQLPDGTYWFSGDYLGELYPSGTQYLFDWRVATAADGTVLWNGNIGWAGGHIWEVVISNLTLVPRALLGISRVGPTSAQITWGTNFADHLLEYATDLSAGGWTTVTNGIVTNSTQLSFTVQENPAIQFYRLRRP